MRFRFRLDKVDSFGHDVEVVSLGMWNYDCERFEHSVAMLFDSDKPCLMMLISDYLMGWSNEWYNTHVDSLESCMCEECGTHTDNQWSWYFVNKKVELVARYNDHFGYSYGFSFDEIKAEFLKIGVEVEFDESMYEIGG